MPGTDTPHAHSCSAAQVQVTEIAVYMDYKLDESYTPSKLSIRAGTSFHDLREIRILDLKEASGWVMIPLIPPENPCAHRNACQPHIRRMLQ